MARTLVRDSSPLSSELGVREAYDAHAGELYRFALRSLGDAGLAEDAVQETFLRAWRAAERFDADLASLRVWLFAIARNVVVDQARRRRAASFAVVPSEPGVVERGTQPVEDPAEALLEVWLVEEALRRLSEDHRHAIVETYLRSRPYADVARERGVPVGTVRSRVFYGLKALRLAMDEMGVEP